MNEVFRVTYWETYYTNKGWSKDYKISINGNNMLIKYVNEIGFNNPKNIKKLGILGIKHKIY